MKYSNLIVLALFSLLSIHALSVPHDEEKKIENLYILGDSLSDVGSLIGICNQILFDIKKNLNHLIWIEKFSFSPPCYKGRSFNNGPMAVEYAAKRLGLTVEPGWSFSIDSKLKRWILIWAKNKLHLFPKYLLDKDFDQIGTCYAIANARILQYNSLSYRLFFNQFCLREQYNVLCKHHPDLGEKDVVFIMIGANDIIEAIHKKNPHKILNKSIQEMKRIIQMLSKKNPRIIVSTLPNLGLIPNFVNTSQGTLVSMMIQEFNRKIKEMVSLYKKHHTKSNIDVLDVSTDLNQLLFEYTKKGYLTDKPCISYLSDLMNFSILSKFLFKGEVHVSYIYPCSEKEISHYLFFDGFHPSKIVHKLIGKELCNMIQKNPIHPKQQ